MGMENMDKVIIGGIAAVLGLTAVVWAVQAYTPKLDYVCPICGAKFATYDELYQHFTSEHPAEPIEIIWE